ncbi:hypothetical protein [Alteribacter keqinensis]|uniref:Nucleotidyltransferase domain-containing protein n=1 Tax=Alteribacter keqinensis TaxID=2483800 RepID=A0A3M7TUG4_9BACI|nr:hypothetical protein [Alteribacter keqinensis]RNA68642.1 hypothetical protein EBO34_01355 [Alteribacter keqinensis]
MIDLEEDNKCKLEAFNVNSERDQRIPVQREKVKSRMEEDLICDDNVIGLYYGGSAAANNMDLYSDLDVRVVVKDHSFQSFIHNKNERTRGWGTVLFFEDPGSNVPYTIAHYKWFFKVDLFIYKLKDLHPSPWLKGIKIIHDPCGEIGSIQRESAALTILFTKDDFHKWRGKTLAYVHEAYRRTHRGEWYYASQCIDSIRWSIAAGWLVEMGHPMNGTMDWAKIEGSRSPLTPKQKHILASWETKRSPSHHNELLKEMVEPYLEVEKKLASLVNEKDRTGESKDIWEMAVY